MYPGFRLIQSSTSIHIQENENGVLPFIGWEKFRRQCGVRGIKTFCRLGIESIASLVQCTEERLLATKNCGATTVREIKEELHKYGMSLAPSVNQ